jgi:hypothetical protein
MKGAICFVIGCFIGSVVTQVWMDRHSENKPEENNKEDVPKESEKSEESPENKEGFREKSSIDDYKQRSEEDRVAYDKIVKSEHYDPAEYEHPKDEDSLEELHEEAKSRPPREITEKEFGKFGYEEDILYYDSEYEILEYDNEENTPIDDPAEEFRIVGDVLKTSGFKDDEEKSVIRIRNYRLKTDYEIYKK